MDSYAVKLYPKAVRDLENIYSYIARKKLAPMTAKAQVNRIKKAILGLRKFPFAYQERLVGRYARRGYRQLLVDNYLAIYTVDEEDKTVYILTIQYQARQT